MNIAFSLTGLVFYLFQLIPNIVWAFIPPPKDVMRRNRSPYPLMNRIEIFSGVLTVALLIMPINQGHENGHILFLTFATIFLALYYLAWIFYYQGVVSPWLLVLGLAAMPPLYFLALGFWMKNYLMLIPCTIFGIAHITITRNNFWK